jgi:metal-responsive CopG/Arc/MetJ family transcriptional regulator
MGAINFYIPNDLMAELLKIDNRSELVANLLRDYFNKGKPLKAIKEEKLKEVNNLIDEVNVLDKEITEEEAEQREREKANNKINETEEKEKELDRKQKQINTCREIFIKNWETPKEELENLLNEFFELLKQNRIKNILEFMEAKQIKRKEKKQY